jgi:hypothetical protein
MIKKASLLLSLAVFEKQAAQKRLAAVAPIACEQCGYQGLPERDGRCPVCAAICGVMPQPAYKKPEQEFENYPLNGNSVEDQYMKDMAEINGYMA